ncbi:MAG: hypothetical protein LAO06_11945 [Acidobacteriia bacterium]|nr:hypothetical protein [Terriglobia bacterium]
MLDFWTSHREFEVFRAKFASHYDRFNRQVLEEGLIEKQVLVGTYYSDEPERGDAGNAVPA